MLIQAGKGEEHRKRSKDSSHHTNGYGLRYRHSPARIHTIDGIGRGEKVFVQRERIALGAIIRIHCSKPAVYWIHVPGAQVVKTNTRIELLARVEIVVWRRACSRDQNPECVVVVRISHVCARARQKTD